MVLSIDKMQRREEGFTLLELSISLLIMALLIGAVAGGTSMMRGAQLRSVLTESQKTRANLGLFKAKYSGLPGDLADATSLWGMAPNASSPAASDAACAALNKNSPSQGTRTCNGDGNSEINTGHEEYRAWQQLANAGMQEGNYTGVGASTTAGVGWQAGINCPKSSFREACWRIFYLNNSNIGSFALFSGVYDAHYVSLWGGALTENTFTPAFTAAEISELDNKADDGKPGTGDILAPYGNASKPYETCTQKTSANTASSAAADGATAVYKTSLSTRVCQIFIKLSL